MAQPQVIEGTSEEIVTLLLAGAFAGQKMRVIIEPDEEDFTDDLPAPPNTICSAAHLEQLLLQGLASPIHLATEDQVRILRVLHAARNIPEIFAAPEEA